MVPTNSTQKIHSQTSVTYIWYLMTNYYVELSKKISWNSTNKTHMDRGVWWTKKKQAVALKYKHVFPSQCGNELSSYATNFQSTNRLTHPSIPFSPYPCLFFFLSEDLSNCQVINHQQQRKDKEPNSWKGTEERRMHQVKGTCVTFRWMSGLGGITENWCSLLCFELWNVI